MKIVVPGGSGQVGAMLVHAFPNDEIVVLSRSPHKLPVKVVEWDAKTLGDWVAEIDGADVVINLARRSVNCRYNAANRNAILDSRVDSTRVIGRAIANAIHPPRVWLQASTATIYAHRYDAANDEETGIIGGDEMGVPETWNFSVGVAKAWEQAANECETPRTRKVLLRSALTLSPDKGGVFDVLLWLVRRGLGGRNGDGRQFVSWIHEADFVGAVKFCIGNEISGPVNLASPNPLPNAEFMRELRRAWGTRIGLPATEWMLGIGAMMMQTETELILKSRRVVPGVLFESGYRFQYPDWPGAVAELCRRWRASGGEIPPAGIGPAASGL